jgi:hypothetical protein
MRIVAALALAALGGCAAKEHAKVGATVLVQADGVVEAPAGATLEVTRATLAGLTPPPEAIVRLAVARDVPWSDVEGLIGTLRGHGKQVAMLVGQRWNVRAIELEQPIAERHVTVLAFVTGKACVRGPGVDAAKCVQSDDNTYVEKAFVRQLVREARESFGVDHVAVEVQGGLPWGDVVNALDGARTCCGDHAMTVAVRTAVDDGTMMVPVE